MEDRIKSVFDFLDRDSCGFVPLRDLGVGLRALGLNPSEAEVHKCMDSVDYNSDTNIDLTEFSSLYQQCK